MTTKTDDDQCNRLAEYFNWSRVEGNLEDGFVRNLSPSDDYGWDGWEVVTDDQIDDALAISTQTKFYTFHTDPGHLGNPPYV